MKILSCAMRGRSEGEWYSTPHRQRLEIGTAISNAVTSVLKDCLIIEIKNDDEES